MKVKIENLDREEGYYLRNYLKTSLLLTVRPERSGVEPEAERSAVEGPAPGRPFDSAVLRSGRTQKTTRSDLQVLLDLR